MHFIDGFVFLEDEEAAPRKTIHQAMNIMGEAVAKNGAAHCLVIG
jgi:hypothetical protein